MEEFENRNVAVVGCSIDSHFSHWAWLNTEKKDGGIKGVKYPLVSDLSKTISQNYDVLAGEYEYNVEDEEVTDKIQDAILPVTEYVMVLHKRNVKN